MTPLEAAQAEVARLELEAQTIPFTTGDKEFIKTTKAAIEQLWKLLGHTRDANAGNGNGRAFLKTIEAIQSRLDALEAAASKTISIPITKVVESHTVSIQHTVPTGTAASMVHEKFVDCWPNFMAEFGVRHDARCRNRKPKDRHGSHHAIQ